MRILVISGLSGSGKSTAVRALEDEGFFCLDNLPVQLFPTFIELMEKSTEQVREVALVIDIRGRDFLKGWQEVFQHLREAGHTVEVFFFDATDEVLIRRFSETRRRHPALEGSPLPEAIRFERDQLVGLRRIATTIVDTSELTSHQLRDLVVARVKGEAGPREMAIQLQSFGYRYGIPLDSDLVLDVRFLPNPYFIPELKPYSGLDPKVRDFVLAKPETDQFLAKAEDLLDFLLPCYRREGKSYLTISVGCTGGRHRSVVIAERLRAFLAERKLTTRMIHRDVDKG